MACGHGFIDNLFITPRGDIVLVETKLWRNPQARREVIAQALDYVAALMTMDYASFEAAAAKAGLTTTSLHALVADQADALEESAFFEVLTFASMSPSERQTFNYELTTSPYHRARDEVALS